MRTIVKALPVQKIIEDLAGQWQVPITGDSGELRIDIPGKLGKGHIRATGFDSGVGMIEYKCTFHEDYEILFSITKTHPLKFIFCREGILEHYFEDDQESHVIHRYQNVIVSSSGHKGHLIRFQAEQCVHVTSIEIVRVLFNKRKNYNYEGLLPELQSLFKDPVAKNKFFYQGNYSLRAADLVEEIDGENLSGYLRLRFLEGKILEMLAVQIGEYQDNRREDKLPQALSRLDLEGVKKAVEIIKDNLDENFSLDELARETGLNLKKLQEGFRYLFGLTVNKYVQEIKLEAAKEMLQNSGLSITEVVERIGLKNASYFSKMFREKYGASPKYFLSPDKPEVNKK